MLLVSVPALAQTKRPAPWVGDTFNGSPCEAPPPTGSFGPYDYRFDKGKLPIVENFHFTPEMEQLRKGRIQDSMQNVRYTIDKFPNHARALHSAIKFSLMRGVSSYWKRQFPAECFLQRAIAYAPDDPAPYQLFGLYHHRLGEAEEALSYYEKAESLSPNDPMLQYNLGLVRLELEQYQQAVAHAEAAYAAGIGFPGLRNLLAEEGYALPESQSP